MSSGETGKSEFFPHACSVRPIQVMKLNPILEEVWRVKDDLAREAGHDIHRLCENTRKWATEHPHPGPLIRTAEELRQFLTQKAQRRSEETETALHDKPPPKT